MKKIILISLFLLSLMTGVTAQNRKKDEHLSFLNLKREQYKMLMKDYFLYECLNSGLKRNGSDLLEKDRSKLFYETFHTYLSDKDLKQILDYAREFGSTVLFSPEGEKQSLVASCMNQYRDAKLEKIVDTIVKKELTLKGLLAKPD